MSQKTDTVSTKRGGRPATHDSLALLAHCAPLIDQDHTLAEICAHGFDFLEDPELAPDGVTIIYRRRHLCPETMQRQERKARAGLRIDVRGLARDMPDEEAQKTADQMIANGQFNWGGKPKIPDGFLPSRTPQRGCPPKG